MTFTATVTPGSGTFDNGGTVQFAVDGINYGSPGYVERRRATTTDSALSVGTHTITATYSGDTNFSGSNGTLSGGQTVGVATTTSLSVSPNPPVIGRTATFMVTVSTVTSAAARPPARSSSWWMAAIMARLSS